MATVAVTQVRKRNGSLVEFDKQRIAAAVRKCAHANERYDKEELAQAIATEVEKRIQDRDEVSVKTLHNMVELLLQVNQEFDLAKSYILYRYEKDSKHKEIPDYVQVAFDRNKQYLKTDLQIFQLLDKFARFDEQLGRRENWEEVCQRVMNYFKWHCKNKNYTLSEEVWTKLYKGLVNLEAAPSMRCVQMAGPALMRDQMGVFNCSFLFLDCIEALVEDLYILMQGTGVGFSVEREYTVENFPRIKRQKKNQEIKTHVIEDTTEGWCNAYRLGLNHWFQGLDIDFDYSQIRPAGARLKTKGGRASGPDPLRQLLSFAKIRILSKQGTCLASIDLHDINCYAHQIVKMGGVRRASGISLSDLDDPDMRDCKQAGFWNDNKQRNQANNSAVYLKKPTQVEFLNEWMALIKSNAGERGIFNRGSLHKQLPARRDKKHVFGTNPCFHPDTRISTIFGMKRLIDLYQDGLPNIVVSDKRVSADSVERKAFGTVLRHATQVELTQRDAAIYLLETTHGYQVRCTDNHEFPTSGGRKQLKDLKQGDTLLLQSGEGLHGHTGSYRDGLVLGMLTGDGTFAETATGGKQAFVDIWEDDFSLLDIVGKSVVSMMTEVPAENGRDYGEPIWNDQTVAVESKQKKRMGGVRLYRYLHDRLGIEDPGQLKSEVPECVWQGNREMVIGYLHGFFAADGSAQANHEGTRQSVEIRLSQSNLELLRQVQQLLLNFGVVTRLYKDRRPAGMRTLPDGKGGNKEYYCEADHELVMNRPNTIKFMDTVGLMGPKSVQIKELLQKRGLSCRKPERFITKVKSITLVGKSDVYCLNQPETHTVIANGLVTSQCGEIILRDCGVCNLSIAVIRSTDNLEQMQHKVELAAIWGTIQSTMTDFKFVRDKWKKNAEEERLLGVDLLGFLDHPVLNDAQKSKEMLQLLRDYAINVNQAFSKLLGINPSMAVTCIKPSGDSSVFYSTAAGFKGWHGEYFVRRTRAGIDNPVALMLKDLGVPCYQDYDSSGWVLEWPVKSPENCVYLKDQTAIGQLELWLTYKTCWTEHNPSVTIYVDTDEWLDVGKWVYDHWDMVGGLSFYPKSDASYPLEPYSAITEEEYNNRVAAMPVIDWAKLYHYEKEDMTDLHQQSACSAGGCEV